MRGRRTPLATLLVLLPALIGLTAAPAAAQEGGEDDPAIDTPYRWIEPSLRVGVHGGHVSADRGALELGPGPAEVFGSRLRVRISNPISLEAGFTYGSSDRYVVDPRLETGPAPVDTVASRWVLAEAAMQFALTGARTWHGLQPYVLIGGGFMVGVDEPQSPRLADAGARHRFEISVAPVVQGGLGVEWVLSDRMGIGFELRDHLWRVTTPDAFFDQPVLDRIEQNELQAPQETDWTHNLGLTVGVWRYF